MPFPKSARHEFKTGHVTSADPIDIRIILYYYFSGAGSSLLDGRARPASITKLIETETFVILVLYSLPRFFLLRMLTDALDHLLEWW